MRCFSGLHGLAVVRFVSCSSICLSVLVQLSLLYPVKMFYSSCFCALPSSLINKNNTLPKNTYITEVRINILLVLSRGKHSNPYSDSSVAPYKGKLSIIENFDSSSSL
jgi:hypothetical protein